MELLIARHGESTGNVVTYDVPDGPLTEKGRRQAHDLARALREYQPTHILASPLLRALETASAIAAECGHAIEVWKDLVEHRSLARYIGPALDELSRRFPAARFGEDLEVDGWVYEGEETHEEAYERAQRVLARLQRDFPAESRVVVVAHGGFNKKLLMGLMKLPLDAQVHFSQANCCINRIRIEGDAVYIGAVNDTSHLVSESVDAAALG